MALYDITRLRDQKHAVKTFKPNDTLADARTKLGAFMAADEQFLFKGHKLDIEDEKGLTVEQIGGSGGGELSITSESFEQETKDKAAALLEKEAKDKAAAEEKEKKDKAAAEEKEKAAAEAAAGAAAEAAEKDKVKKAAEALAAARAAAATAINTKLYTPKLEVADIPDYGPAKDKTRDLGIAAGERTVNARPLQDLLEGEIRVMLGDNRISMSKGTAAGWILTPNGLAWAREEVIRFKQVGVKVPDNVREDFATFTYSEYETKLQSQTVGEAKGGLGVPLIFRVDGQYRNAKARSSFDSTTEIHLQMSQLIPKARVMFDDDIRVCDEFVEAVRAAVKQGPPERRAIRLLEVLERWGEFAAVDMMVGGRIVLSDRRTLTDRNTFESAEQEFKAAADARFSADGVPVEAGAGGGKKDTSTDSEKRINQTSTLRQEVKGGDPSAASSQPGSLGRDWIPTLGSFRSWAIVGFYPQSLVPTLTLLPEDLCSAALELLRQYFRAQLIPKETQPIGGDGGDRNHRDDIDKVSRIAGVEVYASGWLDALVTLRHDGQGGFSRGPKGFGTHHQDRLTTVLFDDDDELTSVEVGIEEGILRTIVLHTAKNRRYPPSGHFGEKNPAKVVTISAPRIRGFSGRSGNAVDRLSLQYLDLAGTTRSREFLLAIEPLLFPKGVTLVEQFPPAPFADVELGATTFGGLSLPPILDGHIPSSDSRENRDRTR